MKILVTGSKGFIGKNLISQLNNIKFGKEKKYNFTTDLTIYEYDMDTNPDLLDMYTNDCDFVFHLAGVNRPQNEEEFMQGNFGFTSKLLDSLKKYNNKATVMISSSVQATLNNPYGISKKAGEELMFAYAKETNSRVFVYRFPNVFGKWCKPNYNSVVATFCNNMANDLPITVTDRSVNMTLVYIDDVLNELMDALNGTPNKDGEYCKVQREHKITLGEIADLIFNFKSSRDEKSIPNMADAFTKKLYATYLSYIPADKFSYPLKMNVDHRGSFTEILRTADRGQFSVNIIKPHITKGNHWHHTKNEKFVVVSGKGKIRFRKVNCDEVIEYFVSGEKMEVLDIPTGYVHNIENVGDTDMVTFMWCNECFAQNSPDTYSEEV